MRTIQPNPVLTDHLCVLLDLGLHPVVDDDGRLRVFGFSAMAPEEARKAAGWIREHADELLAEITAIDTYRIRRRGYCRTCPAYAKGWNILLNGRRHTDWCVHSAWFLGKAARPVPLQRYEAGFEAFKQKGKCPLLRGAE